MRRVLLATPAYDGTVDVWYANSVINAVRLCQDQGIFLHPVWMSYDALVQRARNDLIALAIDGGYDDIIFVDNDMEFEPQWIIDLVNRKEDVVGGTTRKKTDTEEIYVVKSDNLDVQKNGMIKVQGLGTGFVKITVDALREIYFSSPAYTNEGKKCRMVCDVQVIDGQLYSEDTILFKKLSECGYDIWLDPKMTCNHIGNKKYEGNFENWMKRFKKKEKKSKHKR